MQKQGNGNGRGALRPLIAAVAIAALPVTAQAATRGFTITSFDVIRVDAPVKIVLTTGVGASAKADGDQSALDRLRVEVSGRLLNITMERAQPGQKGGAATLRLSTGAVSRVVLTGGGSVALDRMKGLRGEIVLGGNGDVSVGALDLDRLDLSLAGGGRATLAGRAAVANIRVNGPGAVAAEGLKAGQTSIANDGPGSVTLTANGPTKIIASGSGDVTVTGKGACTVENRGTGRVTCGDESY